MSAMGIGTVFDNLVFLIIGICFIYISIAQKEKLGKKAVIARFGGIISTAIGIIGLICVIVKNHL